MNTGQSGSGSGRHPDTAVEVAMPERLAVRADEDESRSRAEAAEMRAEVGHDEIGEGTTRRPARDLGGPKRGHIRSRCRDGERAFMVNHGSSDAFDQHL